MPPIAVTFTSEEITVSAATYCVTLPNEETIVDAANYMRLPREEIAVSAPNYS